MDLIDFNSWKPGEFVTWLWISICCQISGHVSDIELWFKYRWMFTFLEICHSVRYVAINSPQQVHPHFKHMYAVIRITCWNQFKALFCEFLLEVPQKYNDCCCQVPANRTASSETRTVCPHPLDSSNCHCATPGSAPKSKLPRKLNSLNWLKTLR